MHEVHVYYIQTKTFSSKQIYIFLQRINDPDPTFEQRQRWQDSLRAGPPSGDQTRRAASVHKHDNCRQTVATSFGCKQI